LSFLNSKFEVIGKTKEFLIQAKDKLASEYLAPLTKSCRGMIEKFGGESMKLKFDSDTNTLIEENGVNRSLDCYSAGYKDMVSICARVALAEAVFKKEPPFIIFDDPFAELED
jgi:DNA repair exonuclease SbcCD ATPase subunit